MPKNDGQRVLTIKLTEDDHKRLIQLCKIENFISLQEYGENAILHFLNAGKFPPMKKNKNFV